MTSEKVPLVPHIAEAETVAPDNDLTDFMSPSESVIDDRNWALNEDVTRYINDHVFNMLDQTRQDMIPLHEEWRAVARMVVLQHDTGQRYKGRSNAYIPG